MGIKKSSKFPRRFLIATLLILLTFLIVYNVKGFSPGTTARSSIQASQEESTARNCTVVIPGNDNDTCNMTFTDGQVWTISVRIQEKLLVRWMLLTQEQYNEWIQDPDDTDVKENWIHNNPGTIEEDRVFEVETTGLYFFVFINLNDENVTIILTLVAGRPHLVHGYSIPWTFGFMSLTLVGIMVV
ncbi:MAG: hypothetical protein ACTSWN_07265, partial [Promethearchaeota archaeon]